VFYLLVFGSISGSFSVSGSGSGGISGSISGRGSGSGSISGSIQFPDVKQYMRNSQGKTTIVAPRTKPRFGTVNLRI
jgi:hypothetical protein